MLQSHEASVPLSPLFGGFPARFMESHGLHHAEAETLKEHPLGPFFSPCLEHSPLLPTAPSPNLPSAARLPTIPYFDGPCLDLPEDPFLSRSLASPWFEDESFSFNNPASLGFNSSFDSSFTTETEADTTTSSADTTFDSAGLCTPSDSKTDLQVHLQLASLGQLNSRFGSGAAKGLGLGILGLSKKFDIDRVERHRRTVSIRSSNDDTSYSSFREGIDHTGDMVSSPLPLSSDALRGLNLDPFFDPDESVEGEGEVEDADADSLEERVKDGQLSLDYGCGLIQTLSAIPEVQCESWYESENQVDDDGAPVPSSPLFFNPFELLDDSVGPPEDDELRSSSRRGGLKRTSSLPSKPSLGMGVKTRSASTPPQALDENLNPC